MNRKKIQSKGPTIPGTNEISDHLKLSKIEPVTKTQIQRLWLNRVE